MSDQIEQPDPDADTPSELAVFGRNALSVRSELTAQRADTTRETLALQKAIDDAREDLERQRQQMELDYRAQVAALQAQLAPKMAELKKLQELAWTVDLYLGRDEQLELLRDGQCAPQDTPIVIRQLVLAMDEESLINAHFGGIDAKDTDKFFDWLLVDTANLDQIIPEAKGVVVLQPTRQHRDYGNVFEQQTMDEANTQSYWIIRNGDRVYRLVTNVEVGERLVPKRSEFLDFFYEREFGTGERVPMEPGSDKWLKAEAAADARQRHFMRLMLVLQGLLDRTVAFHPLPEGGVNLMSVQAQDDGRVVIRNEIDNVLTTGRPEFREWQKTLNESLRPGMRIIAAFDSDQFANASGSRRDWGRHSRLSPQTASYPQSYTPHLIESRRRDGGLVFRYERTDEIFDAYSSHKPQRRASCTVYPRDSFVLPYDLVSVEELRTYLHSRAERHAYLSMVPLIIAALQAKEAEEEQEAPFRLLLAGALHTEHGDDISDINEALPDMVRTWKIANKWARPLVAPTPEEQAAAIRSISREWAARKRAVQSDETKDRAALATAASLPDVIAVGRRRNGHYVAYAPSAPFQNVWLDEYLLTPTGKLSSVRRWTMPQMRTLNALTMLRTDEQWAEWDTAASRGSHISGLEAAQFVESYLFPLAPGPAIALTHNATARVGTGVFKLVAWANPDRSASKVRRVEDAMVTVVGYWKRDVSGAIVPVATSQYRSQPTHDAYVTEHTHFAWGGSRSASQLSLPGVPVQELADVEKRYGRSSNREVMVWVDDDEWAHVESLHNDLVLASEAEREEHARKLAAARRYLGALVSAYEADRETKLRARFVEDFGTNDEQLWASHRKTLKFPRFSLDFANGAVSAALEAGRPVVGRTLAELLEGRRAVERNIPAELMTFPIPSPDAESDNDN